jgi:hypothetical protein
VNSSQPAKRAGGFAGPGKGLSAARSKIEATIGRAENPIEDRQGPVTGESQGAAFEPPPCFVCVYGQRNGKPLPPVTHIPDGQPMTPPARCQPPSPAGPA